MKFLLGLILLTFLTAIAIFAVQNMQVVNVSFLKWGYPTPVAALTVVAYFLGMISGWNVVAFFRSSLRRVSRED